MSLQFKLHPDHMHIIMGELNLREIIISYIDFKKVITQFLKYYREGYTDISAQFSEFPLESTWQYVAPTHINEAWQPLWSYRSHLYQLVIDNNLFDITFTPPDLSSENIEFLKIEFEKTVQKEWVTAVYQNAQDQIDTAKALYNNVTKESAISFLQIRYNSCYNLPFCNPLHRLAIEMLGGPIKFDESWHGACPIYPICLGAADTNNVLQDIQLAISYNIDDLSKIDSDTLNKIKDLYEGKSLTDLDRFTSIVNEWNNK